MDYLLLARVAKLVALLGFFLPWVTVSCSGTDIIEATGWQLMTGDVKPSGAFAEMSQGQASPTDDADPAPLVIAAFVAAALGLIAGALTKGRAAATIMLVAAIAGMGLSYYSIGSMRSEMMRSANEQQTGGASEGSLFTGEQERDMARAMTSAIQVEEQEGFWLTMAALGVAGLLSLLVLAGASGAATRPTPGPVDGG